MAPHETSASQARARLHDQVTGAHEMAAATGRHPGHWELHCIALGHGPGDFTPHRPPEYVEQTLSPTAGLLELLAEPLGPDHVRIMADRGIEAGQ